ncbi:DUF695 domain-containing protein [Maribacter sp. Hel_I_7]|uniref:DUF695 domain-containing protein n=1 Tax=Maribacter sp. Hel_I_7 TaxID=1249997 RepID=UPI00047B69B5|nr:DUF695 domain-containing protein [Maribacter sp. Hel_I_7]
MEKLLRILLLIVCSTLQLNAQNTQESWDAYMAAYEDGKIGSTTLRMDLIDNVPIEGFNYVLVTGLTYETANENGLPENETFATLHKVADQLMEIIDKETEFITVGSFMYNKERLEYFYLKEPKELASVIENFYKLNYPDYKFYVNIKEDKDWSYYRDFLYPNEETLNYMADQSVLRSLEQTGDKLTKARRVNHWFYFSTEEAMKQCESELVAANFAVNSSGINSQSDLPYELQMYRVDHVDIDTIFPITSQLRITAKKFGGEYDGWETIVVTE